jgi:argininosuccinate lyase
MQSKPSLHKVPAGTFTRLTKAPAESVVRHYYAPIWAAEKPVFGEYLRMNMAWVVMLAEQGIVTREAAVRVLQVLRQLEDDGADRFPFDPSIGDVYFNVEAHVIERVGPDGGILYMGHSRGDGDTTAWRLHVRNGLVRLNGAIVQLADVMLAQARVHGDTVMPGYTGSQPAQPWTFGHYLLSCVDRFERDLQRMQEAIGRVNQSLMGMGVGAGSDLPIDRLRVASLLGFDGLVENSLEWSSVDALLESIAVCSIFLSHLGRLATDLHTWCTQEFRMIELGDEFCTSSSFMPQKKNPYVLDKIRAVAGAGTGLLASALGVTKTLSEEFDLMSISLTSCVDQAVNQSHDMCALAADLFSNLTVHSATMRARALDYWTTVSEIPTLIVRERTLAWRMAHRVCERLVRLALERGLEPLQITGELLDEAAREIAGGPLGLSTESIRTALDPERFLRTRLTVGSPNPAETARMLSVRLRRWKAHAAWVSRRLQQCSGADVRLNEAVRALIR